MFDQFWKLYPRHEDKGKVLTNWKRICSRQSDKVTWSVIKDAITSQKKSERWQDPMFIPHPTTWLRQSRWLDDPKEMKACPDFNADRSHPDKIWDGMHYKWCPDGYYRNASGDTWTD